METAGQQKAEEEKSAWRRSAFVGYQVLLCTRTVPQEIPTLGEWLADWGWGFPDEQGGKLTTSKRKSDIERALEFEKKARLAFMGGVEEKTDWIEQELTSGRT